MRYAILPLIAWAACGRIGYDDSSEAGDSLEDSPIGLDAAANNSVGCDLVPGPACTQTSMQAGQGSRNGMGLSCDDMDPYLGVAISLTTEPVRARMRLENADFDARIVLLESCEGEVVACDGESFEFDFDRSFVALITGVDGACGDARLVLEDANR